MIIGLDVGGTHTDVVLLGEFGLERRMKVTTDTSDLFSSVLTGLEKIIEDVEPEKITHAVLSTTLTTNAIIQKNLPPVGMIVAGGPGIDPEMYAIGEHFHRVKGAIDHRGRQIEPIDENQVMQVAREIASDGIRYVGVVSKFSARNPEHENKIADLIKPMFEKVFVGHLNSGNFSFPRRIATTFLNASVYPIHKDFFEAVKLSLNKKGITIPIYVLKADGGTMDFETSIDFPGQSILSGPAASVMGSIAFASDNGETIVLDVGGTSTDMAVLINGVPVLAPYGIEIEEYKTLIRSLHTLSIGIGGDSVVRVTGDEITIGPDRLGPAMAYGGPVPTPTDALCVLGKVPEADQQNAMRGIEEIAGKLGISTEEAARRIFDQTCRKILAGAEKLVDRINKQPVYTVHEALQGHQINPDRLLVLGGPAPYFTEHLRKITNYTVETVPQWDVANAIGTALSRTTCEITLFADTYLGQATAPEEMFTESIDPRLTFEDAQKIARNLLEKRALREGADVKDMEIDVLEALEFNMIRNFRLIGRNMRIKLQIRPGLISQYQQIARKLAGKSD